jgi:hypothetical protein
MALLRRRLEAQKDGRQGKRQCREGKVERVRAGRKAGRKEGGNTSKQGWKEGRLKGREGGQQKPDLALAKAIEEVSPKLLGRDFPFPVAFRVGNELAHLFQPQEGTEV